MSNEKWILTATSGRTAMVRTFTLRQDNIIAVIEYSTPNRTTVVFSSTSARKEHLRAEAYRFAAQIWDTVGDLADEDPIEITGVVPTWVDDSPAVQIEHAIGHGEAALVGYFEALADVL